MERFDLDKIIQRWDSKKNSLPRKIASYAFRFFKNNYSKEGFEDSSFKKWIPRKNKKNKKPLLVDTGNLKDSIEINSSTFDKISIGTDVEYGIYHNEGTGHLPQREFLGNSQKLEKEIYNMIEKELNNLFK